MASQEDEQQKNRELIQHMLAATLRAVGRRPEGEVTFSRDAALYGEKQARLPRPPKNPSATELTMLRYQCDKLALKWRYHDLHAYRSHVPRTRDARQAFDLAEFARLEALSLDIFHGMAQNLALGLEDHCRRQGLNQVSERRPQDLPQALGLLVREFLTAQPPPDSAAGLLTLWRLWLQDKIGHRLSRLTELTSDQGAFSTAVLEMLRDLELLTGEGASEDSEDLPPEEGAPSILDDAESDDEDPATATQDSEGSGGNDSQGGDDSKGAADEAMTDIAQDLLEDSGGQQDPDNTSQAAPLLETLSLPLDGASPAGKEYKVYTTEYDEIITPSDEAPRDELERLRQQLDEKVAPFEPVILKLANRLMRRLMARQQRRWVFDQEDGFLDPARLSRVVTDPMAPLSYKREADGDFKDTVVTLLLDNSGSMRGRPIQLTAISADILARTLERCGVQVEILGFTTRSWKGGSSRQKWLNDMGGEGVPEKSAESENYGPGRLNDLRHLIYKAAETPWRRARANLGFMLRDGVLKENIDGEALVWAWQRLMRKHQTRRILMVISDGAPVDDSTLSANSGGILEQHLRQVIGRIESSGTVELKAIGIGHDVTRFYQDAITLTTLEDIGPVLVEELGALF